jgi:predicted metal-dependent phosphoesterase TrpH
MLVKLDYHIHSYYSYDSLNRPSEILRVTKSKGINCLSITDHNTIKGSVELLNIKGEYEDIIKIIGIEIKTNYGDLIVLGLNENIKTKDMFEILDICKLNGYVSILPHPFRNSLIKVDSMKEVYNRVDLIEGYNARTSMKSNLKAIQLAKELDKSYTGGSDAHLLNEIGNAITYVKVDTITVENVLKSLKNGLCFGKFLKQSSQLNRIATIVIQSIKRI